MPATSPYSGNDYQAVSNFRPYELPVNDIFKAISAQNQFWDAGAARVKSYYDKGLNLDLTSEENIKIRDQFMKDAEKELIKLSSMDLSDPSVQKNGMSIFKSLFKDKAILYDDHMTRTQKQIYADADRYKNDEKTKGAGFHMDNLAYALMPFRNFGKDTKRDELEGIYNRAKNAQYTPYYDVSKERKDILNDCKPDKYSNTTSQGMYLEEERVASLTSQKLWGCLEAGLSDQAKQQIRISGVVRYGNDYNSLKNDYIDAAKEESKYYDDQIKSLAAERAAYAGKQGYEKDVEQIDKKIKDYKKGKEKYDNALLTYNTWDEKYMKDNYEDLAYTAYMKRANGAFADAFARMDIEKTKKADPIAMMYYTQEKLDERQQAGFRHDENMEQYKLQLKLLTGDTDMDEPSRIRALQKMGVPNEQIYSWLGQAEKEAAPESTAIQSTIDKSDTAISSKVGEITQFVQNNPDLAIVVAGVKDEASFTAQLPKLYEYVNTALKTDPNDVKALELREGLNAYIKLVNERTHWKSILDDAQSKAMADANKDYPDVDMKKELNQINEGKAFPMRLWLNGSDYNNTITLVKTPEQVVQDIDSGVATIRKDNAIAGYLEVTYNIDGKRYSLEMHKKKIGVDPIGASDMRRPLREISNWYSKNQNFRQKKQVAYQNKTNQILGENAAVQKMILSSGNLLGDGKVGSTKPTKTLKFVQDVFGSTIGAVQYNTVGGFDPIDGWVDIQATDSKGEPISAADLEKAAAKSQIGASQIEKSKYPNAVRIKIPYLAGVMQKPDYNETLKTLMTYGGNRVINENLAQGLILDSGITPTGKRVQVKTTKSLATGTPKYTILIDGQEIPVKIGNDQTTALNYLSMLISGKAEGTINQ